MRCVLARSVTLNIVGQVGGLAIGFAASIVLARWLGPSDRGLLAIMLAVITFSASLASLGLPWAIEYYASRRAATAAVLLGNTLAYGAVLALVFVPAGWLLRHALADHVGHGRGGATWIFAAALVPVAVVSNMITSQLSGALRFAAFNAVTVVSRLVYLLAVVTTIVIAR